MLPVQVLPALHAWRHLQAALCRRACSFHGTQAAEHQQDFRTRCCRCCRGDRKHAGPVSGGATRDQQAFHAAQPQSPL